MLLSVPPGSASAFISQAFRWMAIVLATEGSLPELTVHSLMGARRTFASSTRLARERFRLPNCVGALDGWVTGFDRHMGEVNEYWNYKEKRTALNHLILWDGARRPRVLWADVGNAGRMNDPQVMMKSQLGQAIHFGCGPLAEVFKELSQDRYSLDVVYVDSQGRNRARKVSPYVVGDAAFRLDDALMTPFRWDHVAFTHSFIDCLQ